MNAVIPFNFQHHEVRVVTIDGEPHFVAKDVAVALGYANHSEAISRHCRGVAKRYPIQDSLGRGQDARVIGEADVMRLIVSSKLPAAVEFERTVFEDILPTIRKTGSYGHAALSDDEIVAQALQITSAKVRQLEAKVVEDAPKVEYVDNYVAPDDDVVQFRIAAQQLGIGEVALRKLLSDAKWAYRANLGRRWSEKEQRMIDVFEWRPYAHHADKFQLRPQHNAPRHHNGQVRQTLYIKSVSLPKIADLIEYGDERLIDEVTA